MNRFLIPEVYKFTMKVNRVFLVATVAAISSVAVTSCAYDPYYSGSSYSSGPRYASGYGSGYGYGGRNFTTTYFVSTGNPRWGYDPYSRCYYDYSRRCYYDPYLYGYYPVGYRPRYVHGAPHPHGWRTGHMHIAPPSRIRDYRLDNYDNRSERYRSLDNNWSRNVQVNTQVRESGPYRTAQTSNDRILESRSQTYEGSTQLDSRSPSIVRNREVYGNESQIPKRSEQRMVQPRKESTKSSRSAPVNQNERSTRSYPQSAPERSERRNESFGPEVRNQPESRGSVGGSVKESRQREQAATNSNENAEQRFTRQR